MYETIPPTIRLTRIKYELQITPPPSFWRYTDLYTHLNQELQQVLQTTPFTDYVIDIDQGNQPAGRAQDGIFSVLCIAEVYEDVQEALNALAQRITHLIGGLEGVPTSAEGQAFLQRYFDQYGYCHQCGGLAQHHTVAYNPEQPFRDDHAHWYFICRHPLPFGSLEREQRINRLQRGEAFLP